MTSILYNSLPCREAVVCRLLADVFFLHTAELTLRLLLPLVTVDIRSEGCQSIVESGQ